jgi:hypothetical protein
MSSLELITDSEYAERTVRDSFKQSGYDLLEWTGRGLGATLTSTYYSESETGILRIRMVSGGKSVSASFTGSSYDVARATHLWASFWDMILRRY